MKKVLPVSLILTTLNEASTIQAFFSGVASGTVLPAEMVVCDGGSTDGTLELLKTAAIEGTLITIISEPGATIARGRNTAIASSTYEVLAITDAGCEIDPHWLERITQPLLSNKRIDAVAGGYHIRGTSPFQDCAAAAEIPVERRPIKHFLPSSRSFAVRKAAFNDAGRYPEHLSFAGEDTALCLSLKTHGKHIEPVLDAVVTWAPRATFEAFIKQHWLYGVGDGEMIQHHKKYIAASLKACLFIGVLALSAVHWFFILLYPMGLVLYYIRLTPLYGWNKQVGQVSFCGFVLVIVKEIAMLSGYLKGRLFRPAKDTVR